MIEKNKVKKLCFSLAVVLCVTSFTGCGKKKDGVADNGNKGAAAGAAKIDKEHIYKQEDLEGILEDGEVVTAMDYVGGKIRAVAQTGNEKSRCISFNTDGSDVQSFDIDGGKECSVWNGTFDNDGNVYMIVNEVISAGTEEETEESDERNHYLVKADATGKELYRIDLSEEFKEEAGSDFGLIWTEKFGLVLFTPKGIQTYDEKNGFGMIKISQDYMQVNYVSKVSDNLVLVNYYDENTCGDTAETVDLDTKKVNKNFEGLATDQQQYGFFAGCGNLYVADGNGAYKYDLNTSKLDEQINFEDSNIDSFSFSSDPKIVALSDTEIIANIKEYNSGTQGFARITKVNPEDITDKTIITISLGLTPFMGDVENEIRKFNRANDKYMVKIIDYNELYPDDPNKQFNLDVLSGKGPDIMVVSDEVIRSYADKGIFLDLTAAFDKGGPLGDIELLPNIREMMKVDGKTYTFMTSFFVDTCLVRSEFAEGRTSLTFKECDDLIQSKGTDYNIAFGGYMTGSQFLCKYWQYYGDKFVDWKNKKCNFKDPEFTELLNFAAKFPNEEKDTEIGDFMNSDQNYLENKALFYTDSIGAFGMDQYIKLKQIIFRDGFDFVGYPSNSGENIAAISADTFAVNSKTSHADVIYDLIREMLLAKRGHLSQFSTVKPLFEEQLQEATKERKNAYVYDVSQNK